MTNHGVFDERTRIALEKTLRELEDPTKHENLSPLYKKTLLKQVREELGIGDHGICRGGLVDMPEEFDGLQLK